MRIRIVDAFTDRPFSGNPAAVALLDTPRFPDDAAMRRVAAEMNLSETAFAHRLAPGAEADWALRWFTPAAEVALCGHATLATAHVLRESGAVSGPVRFATLSGVLTADVESDGHLTLDFPTATLTPHPDTGEVSEALGSEVRAAWETGPFTGDLLAELADEQTVRTVRPDSAALARLPFRGVGVTAAADGTVAGHDFVSRFFAPAQHITEDPVTGSAHTALAPLWSERFGRTELTGYQASGRGGVVRTALRGDRVLLTGRAVTVLDGRLRVTP